MEIKREPYTIRPWRMSDAADLARSANNINIWRNMRDGFPYPYAESDAVDFISMCEQMRPVTNFAIEVDGKAVGGVGYQPHTDVERFSAETGYWLAEPYWGRGIVAGVMADLIDYVWNHTEIVRLYAGIFAFNAASGRVLEKTGFRRVGVLEKAAFKEGRFVDKVLYEIVKPEFADFPDVVSAQSADLPVLAEIWEAAVRATHSFLTEPDILFFRHAVREEYLPSATLFCIRSQGVPRSFIGVNEREIETLFVHPDVRGNGLGQRLLQFAVARMGADRVDVNEQNDQAVGFYRRMGFEVVGRDPVDGYGKPFPILHMRRSVRESNDS